MDKAEFWSTKAKLPEYHAVVFEHPAFEAPFRLVANVFEEVTLSGAVHIPAPMQIKPPDTVGNGQPMLTLAFPRIVVGREFKRQLKRIAASGSRAPITVTYNVYLDDVTAPQLSWKLYAAESGGIVFGADQVQVSATDDNLMRRAVAPIYDPSVWTGLELI